MPSFKKQLNLTVCSLFLLTTAAANAIDFRFQSADPHVKCGFNRSGAVTADTANSRVFSVDVAVMCEQPFRYYINTDLAPGHVYRGAEGVWYVSSAITGLNESCEDALKRPSAAFFQDSPIGPRGGESSAFWRVCVGVNPLDDSLKVAPVLDGSILLTLHSEPIEAYPDGTEYKEALFEHNGTKLTKDSKAELGAWLSTLKPLSGYKFEIHANASDRGESRYNHTLSIKRLAATRSYMTSQHKIVDSQIWGQAWGDQRLKALNSGERFDALNRRVSVVAIPHNEKVYTTGIGSSKNGVTSVMPSGSVATDPARMEVKGFKDETSFVENVIKDNPKKN